MAMLSNLDLIRRVPIFSLLTNDQAQGIADSVVKRRYRRGEIIVEHGRKSNALFILLTGRARVLTADSRGREVILAVLQSGDYVGEMSLIDNEPHSATVRAEIQTDMLILGRRQGRRVSSPGPGPRRIRALPAGELQPVLRDHAWPRGAPAQCRPADRVAGAAGCLRASCPVAAGHGRSHR